MASVLPPAVTYTPSIPEKTIKAGALSDAQLEPIVYAGASHERMLENGTRRGYFVGDGTGVGKGRIIAGIILDNWNKGRRRAVWLSEKWKLLEDAKRDMAGIGGDPGTIISVKGTSPEADLAQKDGVLFTTYDTLKGEAKTKGGKPGRTRLEQLIDWLGGPEKAREFDGVIAFDEAHKMGNAIDQKGTRGVREASKMAKAGLALQDALPKARIVYVSATGATEVSNLAYAERLGLWGPGTAFPTREAFINGMGAGGVATMELVARDMKALGLYTARNLSFDGVQYARLVHDLTPRQRADYDTLAEAWQLVLRNINSALKLTAADRKGTVNGHAKARALSAFWGNHQRFFNQVITSMSMPSVVSRVERDIADGKAVVIQLVNTFEATTERQLATVQDEEDLEALDLTPRETLMQYVQNAFPVQQMEEFTDADGNKGFRVVVDSAGNAVENPEAVALREELLSRLGSLKSVPDGPLELLINHFGPNKVAEVTGRKRRVVRLPNGKTEVQKRGSKANGAEIDAFMADRKPIIVFSNAGGTGASYHADRGTKNQRERQHYLLQAGWRADQAVQGLGRSHRANQVQPPFYRLVSTDLPGHRRFISTIARRLDQLGALTKGERKTGGQGLFSELDNLESSHARDALRAFILDLHHGAVPDLTMQEYEEQTGLKLRDSNGQLIQQPPQMSQFLNRLLSLTIDKQNAAFDAFFRKLEANIELSIQAGTLDVGVENLKADKIEKVSEQTVFTDPESGAETKYVELKVHRKNETLPFPTKPGYRFVENKTSGKVSAIDPRVITKTDAQGNVIERRRLLDPAGTKYVDSDEVTVDDQYRDNGRFKELQPEQARAKWEEQVAKVPKYKTVDMHLISGAVLPIWDRLPAEDVKVFRVVTSDGQRMLGRLLPHQHLRETLTRLGATAKTQQLSPEEAFRRVHEERWQLSLANGWRIHRATVGGEDRLELSGPEYDDWRGVLQPAGLLSERISWTTRYFIPSVDVLKKLIRDKPIVDAVPPKGTSALAPSGTRIVGAPSARGGKSLGAAAPGQVGLPSLGERLLGVKQSLSKAGGGLGEALGRLTGYGQGPAKHMDALAEAKDVFGGYGLNLLEKIAPDAAVAARLQAASRQKAKILIDRLVPQLEKILGSPEKVDQFWATLGESRLEGIREFATEVAERAENDSEDAFLAPDRLVLYSFMGEALEGRTAFEDQEVAEPIRKLVDIVSDPETTTPEAVESLRDLVSSTAQVWAQNIGEIAIAPGVTVESQADDPDFQKALKLYRELDETALRDAHVLNDGWLSTHLGPLNAYFPLVAATRRIGGGRTRPAFQKPRNPQNYMATGLADEYDVSIEAHARNMARAFRQDGRAGLIGALQQEGLLTPVRPGTEAPKTVLFRGEEYEAKTVETGVARIIAKDGRVVRVPPQRSVIPKPLYDELGPLLETNGDRDESFLKNVLQAITVFNLGGPTDAVFHTANVLGAVILRAPIVGLDAFSKAISAVPLARSGAAIANILASDPGSPRFAKRHQERYGYSIDERFRQMAENGMIPSRFGTATYSKTYARQTGAEYQGPHWPLRYDKEGKLKAELPLAFGPMIYGPHGIDIRARILMDMLGEEMAKTTGGPWDLNTRARWNRMMGNYVFETEGRFERLLKSSGFAPFATAGRGMNWNGIVGMLGAGHLPVGGSQSFNRYRAITIINGILGLAVAWAVISKLVREKWPWEDEESRFGWVPLTPEMRATKLARMVYGDDLDKTAWVNLAFFNPLTLRGMRITGLRAAVDSKLSHEKPAPAFDRGLVDSLNGWLHPMLGPPAQFLFKAIAGVDPYILTLNDRGRPAIKFKPGMKEPLAQGPESVWQRLKTALLSANPIIRRVTDAKAEGQPATRVVADTVAPNLAKGPYRSRGSELEQALSEWGRASVPDRARTKEEEDRSERIHGYTSRLRNAKGQELKDVRAELAAEWRAGKLRRSEAEKILRDASRPALQARWENAHLPLEKAFELWNVATPDEKRQVGPLLMAKVRKPTTWAELKKNRTPEEYRQVQEAARSFLKDSALPPLRLASR